MRIILTLSLSLLILNLSSQNWIDLMLDQESNFFEVQKEFYKEVEKNGTNKTPGFKQFKRWEHFMESRVDQDGYFRNANATHEYYELYKKTLKEQKGAAGNWTQIGPFGAPDGGGSGRTNCIAFHPTNSSIILVGAASGGLWRSVNGGSSWTTNTDGLENLGISDIEFSPSNPNIVYAATGDRDAGDTYSIGIIKSIDGGLTWQTTGLSYTPDAKRRIYKILVHPQNDSILYIASSLGLRKSTDRGDTWTLIRAGSFIDMKFKPNDPNTIYAATATIIIKTVDEGQTWTTLSIPMVSASRRLLIGVTAANPNIIYVVSVKSSDNGFNGLYRSTDAGATFTLRASSPNVLGWASNGSDSGGQGWYDLGLGVSQTNENLLFIGGINIWKSINGGTNWTLSGHWTASGAPYVHADIHEIKFSPHNANTVWACTDGGLSVSTANGANWIEKNSGLSIAQIYRIGGSAQNATKILSGWQDNGTNLNNANDWSRVLGGDGMECIIDYSNQNYMYGSLYYGEIKRSTNGGASWTEISNSITEEGAWVTPYLQDPNTAATLYAGYKNVYKTTNRGNSWTKISTFGTTLNINALAVSKSNSNIIVAANDSYLWKTTDGGTNWTNITSVSFGVGNITSIAIHPTNPNKIWITLSGFTANYKVFATIDGGNSWINLSSGLPNLPANTIVYENNSPDGIYLGMDVGVYYRDTIINQWIPFMLNLPNVIVKELEIFYAGNKIRAATYGRGIWESPLYKLANSISKPLAEKTMELSIRPNPSRGIFELYLENQLIMDTQIEIYNSTGTLIKQLIISNTNNYKLDLTSEAAGLYYMKILNNQSSSTYKLIIN